MKTTHCISLYSLSLSFGPLSPRSLPRCPLPFSSESSLPSTGMVRTSLVLAVAVAVAFDCARGRPVAGGAGRTSRGDPGARSSTGRVGHGDGVYSRPLWSAHNGGTVFVGSDDSKFYAVDASTGIERWNYSAGGPVYSSPVLSIDGLTVFFGSESQDDIMVSAVDAIDGTWNRGMWHKGGIMVSSPTLSPDGYLGAQLFFGSDDFRLYAMPMDDGAPIRYWTTGAQVYSTPAVSRSGGTVYVGSLDNKIYAWDVTGPNNPGHNETPKWTFTTGDSVVSSPALSVDGATVFVGSCDNKLYALDAHNGSLQWSYTTGDAVYSSPTVSHDGTTVFVGSDDAKLYALDARNGSFIWSFTTGGPFEGTGPALSPDGETVFVGGSESQWLYAVDASNGIQKWNFSNDVEATYSSPTVSGDGAYVYVGCNIDSIDDRILAVNARILAVNASTGILEWRFNPKSRSTPTGGYAESSPAVSVDGAAVFVGSGDEEPYAVDTGPAPPPTSTTLSWTTAPALLPCDGRDGEACALVDLGTWCCNLEVHHCVCAQYGTADELRQICSALNNGGIDCEKCAAAPQCRGPAVVVDQLAPVDLGGEPLAEQLDSQHVVPADLAQDLAGHGQAGGRDDVGADDHA